MAARPKAKIPWQVRREIATRYGCPPGGTVVAPCHYCAVPGQIWWPTRRDGKPSAWVHFAHEIDHVVPESAGGPTVADNLVLACRRCNRRKSARV